MGHRSTDLRDGTLQDIQHICSSMEQLLLSYKSGEIPYIYIANFLELLFQSARTRICVLRKPDAHDVHDNVFPIEELDKLVVFATFRKQEMYHLFLKQLSSRLHKYGEEFLERECERLDNDKGCFYICLSRVFPAENNLFIGRSHNKEAYRRLETLLHLLTEDSKTWGLDIPAEIYTCFSNIPDEQNSICKLSPADTPCVTAYSMGEDEQGTSRIAWSKARLKPIERWVEYVYEQNHGIPLVQVAQPGQPEQDMGYSNLFFWVRINDVRSQHGRADDSFKVKLICPPQQRRELSLFFHGNRRNKCSWYIAGGECRISGMGKCLCEHYWSTLPETVTNNDEIFAHYAPLWEQLSEISNSDFSKSEMAFRSSSILFDRRQKRTLDSGDKSVLNNTTGRDRVGACITFRMMTPATQGYDTVEDQIPQIMFVPIYAGAAPFVLVSTVVNAQLPAPFHDTLSEWRRAYRFAGMVFQFMASRLKEAARKAYLNEASEIVQELYTAYRLNKNKPACDSTEALEEFLNHTNTELDELSKIYPYHKIILAKVGENVIKEEGQDVFETPEGIALQVLRERNPYWRSFSSKPFFSAVHVARKFYSGMARTVAISDGEKRDWQAFFFWHSDHFGFPPPSKEAWRTYAGKRGWRNMAGVHGEPPASDPDATSNVVPFKK